MTELRGAIQPSFSLDPAMAALAAIENLWLITATALVLFMQAGFLMLEAGSVRSKNTINVAQKNMADLLVCGLVFFLFGSVVMFGAGTTGFFGFGGFSLDDSQTRFSFMYQFAFCATAATIVSGAVSERMTFAAYMILTALIAGLIYPVFGHLVWGGVLISGNPAFLADIGFLDFAGSTVVHVIGGAAALAAVTLIGPRLGRFDDNGRPISIRGHSSVLSNFGVMVLVIGWIGFNAGAASPTSPIFSTIVLNTMAALVFGGIAGLLYSAWRDKGRTHPRTSGNGILGGLVAITAGCAYVDVPGAALIGFAGGLGAVTLGDLLLKRFKIDDPVDVISVHLGAGIIGTLLLAFLAAPEHIAGSRLTQFAIQCAGTFMAFGWSFAITRIGLGIVQQFIPLRVSSEAEQLGLNLAEHDDEFDAASAQYLMNQRKKKESGIGKVGEGYEESTVDQNTQINALTRIVEGAKQTRVEAVQAQNEIEELATRDHLTRLLNRTAFKNLASVKLQQAEKDAGECTVFYMDLDGFKRINDGFGHSVGDQVLGVVSQRISHACGSEAILARFGGDEFVLHMDSDKEHSPPTWETLGQKIVNVVSEKITIGELELHLGISVGAAVYPHHGKSLEKLIVHADMALNAAKIRGKGRCVSFESQMADQAQRRKELEHDMRVGMSRGEFFAHYQPQKLLETGKLSGFEALMRWEHPVHGMIMPGEFIPIAESTGLIVPLSEQLICAACVHASQWPMVDGKHLSVSVNVSPSQFLRSDVPNMLKAALKGSGLAPELLEIEITESMLIENVPHVKAALEEIGAQGIHVAVDDFGTGFASLTYLQEFPINRIKVDRSFVKDLESNVADQRITKAIVDLGRGLGLTVVAEGVETEGQRRKLHELHCDHMQGYLYSPPVPLASALQLIVEANLEPNAEGSTACTDDQISA